MALPAYGWRMTAPGALPVPALPRVRGGRCARPGPGPAVADLAPALPVDLESYVEPQPLDVVIRAFEAVRRREIAQRAVLVP